MYKKYVKKKEFAVMSDILVAMSGGVDSSVAAYSLKSKGFTVSGVYLRLASVKDESEDALNAAKRLDLNFYISDRREDFKNKIVARFASEYSEGLTPNPCVFCNETMKFPALFDVADEHSITLTATGHYAGIYEQNGVFYLRKSKNTQKDQSYMLYRLDQKMLSRLLFPIGDMNKDEVRTLAEEAGIAVAHKADSQDICFVPDGDYRSVLNSFYGASPEKGAFVYEDGRVIGTHNGIWGYTVGQRKGLGIAWEHPLYVLGKDVQKNTVIVGKSESLFSDPLTASNVVYCSEEMPNAFRCEAKVRYSHGGSLCTVTKTGDNTVKVVFDTPQRAITRGQSVVFYDGDTVIGGGYID